QTRVGDGGGEVPSAEACGGGRVGGPDLGGDVGGIAAEVGDHRGDRGGQRARLHVPHVLFGDRQVEPLRLQRGGFLIAQRRFRRDECRQLTGELADRDDLAGLPEH